MAHYPVPATARAARPERLACLEQTPALMKKGLARMTDTLLDPWDDAAEIARRLEAGDRLVVMIGAEAWCTSCQVLRPVFERFAGDQTNQGHVFLWLDLEDHSEFIGDFVPPSLPFLLAYDRGALTHGLIVDDLTTHGLGEALASRQRIEYEGMPSLHERLLLTDWSS